MNKPRAMRQLSYAVALLYNQMQTLSLYDVRYLTKWLLLVLCNDAIIVSWSYAQIK